ncbi:MAG: ASPIC/UnbV domain-containing protein, partial [bacterium]
GSAIEVDLVGDESGPTAVGARVTAWAAGNVVRRRVSANSWRGFADPGTVHLGLGAAAAADSLTVEWPAGGVETYFHVAAREYRVREGRQVAAPSILTVSPDSIAPTQTGFLAFEVTDSTGARVSGEAPNFTLTSLAGLLVPGASSESADSTYAFAYESGTALGVDTLVVTDALSWPPRSDSLEVRVAIYPDTIRVAADGPPRVHWNESLPVRVSILDANGNRLPDGGAPFAIESLAGLGTLGPRAQEPDSSWTVAFVAGGGTGVAVDTLVASDPEAVAVDADSLAVEVTDRAIVESVADVENDQGRQVRVTWQRDLRDTTGAATPITHYAVWRRLGQSETWQPVGPVVPAATLPAYEAVVPTLADSSGFGGIQWSVFRVRAHTAAPAVFFDSAPDSGWSVDNLAPGPPGPVTFVTSERIEWEEPIDPNWSYFAVYASEEPDFGTATALGVTTALAWEPVPAPFAFVTAVDLAGNESEASSAANPTRSPDGLGIASLTFLGGGRPNPFRGSVRIDFGLERPDAATLVVYDVRGRRVRVLREGPAAPGRHVESWNGLDAAGRQVVPGVYFVSFESGAFRSTRKIVRLR